jgi:hypothetical protein
MSLNFPSNPTGGQTFQSGDLIYEFDGTKWKGVSELVASGVGYDDTTSGLGSNNVQGAIEILASAPSDQLVTDDWVVEQSTSELVFKYQSTTVFKITSTGEIDTSL